MREERFKEGGREEKVRRESWGKQGGRQRWGKEARRERRIEEKGTEGKKGGRNQGESNLGEMESKGGKGGEWSILNTESSA